MFELVAVAVDVVAVVIKVYFSSLGIPVIVLVSMPVPVPAPAPESPSAVVHEIRHAVDLFRQVPQEADRGRGGRQEDRLEGTLFLQCFIYFLVIGHRFGKYLPSQDAASVVLLNIPSFASGTDLWGKAKEKDGFAPPSISDGLIEIVGIASTFHMGRIQVHENYTILANATHETMQNP